MIYDGIDAITILFPAPPTPALNMLSAPSDPEQALLALEALDQAESIFLKIHDKAGCLLGYAWPNSPPELQADDSDSQGAALNDTTSPLQAAWQQHKEQCARIPIEDFVDTLFGATTTTPPPESLRNPDGSMIFIQHKPRPANAPLPKPTSQDRVQYYLSSKKHLAAAAGRAMRTVLIEPEPEKPGLLKLASNWLRPQAIEFAQRMTRVTAGKRFFGTRGGKFGLGPWGTALEDVVAVFGGAEVPMIVRRVEGVDGIYRLVGDGFVKGMMRERDVEELVGRSALRDIFLV